MALNLIQLKEKIKILERQREMWMERNKEFERELEKMRENIREIEKIIEDIER